MPIRMPNISTLLKKVSPSSEPELKIVEFDISESKKGRDTTLYHLWWSVNGANKVEVTPSFGVVKHTKPLLVPPIVEDTTYTIKAWNRDEHVVERSLFVPCAKITSFEANEYTAVEGKRLMLSWEVDNAERIIIEPNIGDVTGRDMIETTVTRSTSTYWLKIYGKNNWQERAISIAVIQPPVFSWNVIPQPPSVHIQTKLNIENPFVDQAENIYAIINELKGVSTIPKENIPRLHIRDFKLFTFATKLRFRFRRPRFKKTIQELFHHFKRM